MSPPTESPTSKPRSTPEPVPRLRTSRRDRRATGNQRWTLQPSSPIKPDLSSIQSPTPHKRTHFADGKRNHSNEVVSDLLVPARRKRSEVVAKRSKSHCEDSRATGASPLGRHAESTESVSRQESGFAQYMASTVSKPRRDASPSKDLKLEKSRFRHECGFSSALKPESCRPAAKNISFSLKHDWRNSRGYQSKIPEKTSTDKEAPGSKFNLEQFKSPQDSYMACGIAQSLKRRDVERDRRRKEQRSRSKLLLMHEAHCRRDSPRSRSRQRGVDNPADADFKSSLGRETRPSGSPLQHRIYAVDPLHLKDSYTISEQFSGDFFHQSLDPNKEPAIDLRSIEIPTGRKNETAQNVSKIHFQALSENKNNVFSSSPPKGTTIISTCEPASNCKLELGTRSYVERHAVSNEEKVNKALMPDTPRGTLDRYKKSSSLTRAKRHQPEISKTSELPSALSTAYLAPYANNTSNETSVESALQKLDSAQWSKSVPLDVQENHPAHNTSKQETIDNSSNDLVQSKAAKQSQQLRMKDPSNKTKTSSRGRNIHMELSENGLAKYVPLSDSMGDSKPEPRELSKLGSRMGMDEKSSYASVQDLSTEPTSQAEAGERTVGSSTLQVDSGTSNAKKIADKLTSHIAPADHFEDAEEPNTVGNSNSSNTFFKSSRDDQALLDSTRETSSMPFKDSDDQLMQREQAKESTLSNIESNFSSDEMRSQKKHAYQSKQNDRDDLKISSDNLNYKNNKTGNVNVLQEDDDKMATPLSRKGSKHKKTQAALENEGKNVKVR